MVLSLFYIVFLYSFIITGETPGPPTYRFSKVAAVILKLPAVWNIRIIKLIDCLIKSVAPAKETNEPPIFHILGNSRNTLQLFQIR